MGKPQADGTEKVTVRLNEEESKVLVAIGAHLTKKEATTREWKEVARRFGFRDHKQLKRYLYDRLPGNESDAPELNQVNGASD